MKYTFKVWFFTITIAPIILFLFWVIITPFQLFETIKSLPILIFMLLYGLVLSSPAMLLFAIIKWKILILFQSNKAKKILSIYSFASVWITFYTFDKEFLTSNLKNLAWPIIYSTTIVIAVWLFKLKEEYVNYQDKK